MQAFKLQHFAAAHPQEAFPSFTTITSQEIERLREHLCQAAGTGAATDWGHLYRHLLNQAERIRTANPEDESRFNLDANVPEAVYVRVLLPHLHPHLIRHACVTERFSLIDELFPDDAHKRKTLHDLVESDIGWKSPETKQHYIHTLSASEALELVNDHWVRRLMERAYTLDTALRPSEESGARRAHTLGGTYPPEVAESLDWVTTLKCQP